MSGIDWSKAPADAQGFMPYDGMWISGWWKDDGGSRYFWSMQEGDLGGWKKSYANPFEQPGFIKRPSPAWNGKGLPPVGVTLEYMWNYKPEGSEYVQVEILVHDKGSAVMRTLDGPDPGVLRESRGGYCGSGRGQPIFRPICTPEQIAADEQNKAVAEMMSHVVHATPIDCELLYRAGYRKQADQ